MLKVFSLILIVLVFNSCKPDDSYNPNYDGDKLVVNGVIEANIGVTVDVSKSQSPGGIIPNGGYKVKNPRVWLYQNDSLIGEMKLNATGKFGVNFKPQVGKFYKLKAVADNLDTVESLPVLVPDFPKVGAYSLRKDSSYAGNSGKNAALFSFELKDKANEKNFYAIDSYVQITKDSISDELSAGVFPNLTSCEFITYRSTYFTDKCFDGSSFTVNYVTDHRDKGVWKIELSSINKNFYTYYKNLDQPPTYELAFVEPNIATSNMKNGYGILVAKSTRSFSLKLD
jgi:Domain of unknown function (DUF4249)